jgi:hypothetical protein
MSATSTADPAAGPSGPRRGTSEPGARAWRIAVGASIALVSLVRWWVARGRTEFAIWPDEPAQLAIARFASGGTRWNMDDHSVWRPLYGVLIAPLHWWSDDPVTVFQAALGVNAVLGGLAAGVMVLLARRLTTLSPPWCAVAAVAVSLAPMLLFTTDFVWAESLALLLFVAAVLLLSRFDEAPGLRSGLAAVAVAVAGFGAHSRLLVVSVLFVGLVVVAFVERRLRRHEAAVVLAALAAGLVAVSAMTSWFVDRLWDEPSDRNSAGSVIGRLDGPIDVLVAAVGQIWYLLVATVGIVAYGVIQLVRRFVDRSAPRVRRDAAIVLAVAVVSIALSAVFMADRPRVDQLVYGRYNAVAVAPVLLVGLGALLDAPRRMVVWAATVGASTLAAGALLWLLRRDLLASGNGLEPMILGLQPFVAGETLPVLRISVAATVVIVGLGVVAGVGAGRPIVVTAALVAVLVVGGLHTRAALDDRWDDSGDASSATELADGALAAESGVDYHLPPGSTSTKRMMLLQYYLPAVEFTVVADPVAPSDNTLVFARTDDAALQGSGARLLWVDPGRSVGLWSR